MDGLEASRKIRELEKSGRARKTVPIIAMTANAFSEDVRKCIDAGMNDHIAKPIELDKFFSVITNYLG
jgi:CheY-like chemotaxis protein